MCKNICSAFHFLEPTGGRTLFWHHLKTVQYVFVFHSLSACTHVYVKHTHTKIVKKNLLRKKLGKQLYIIQRKKSRANSTPSSNSCNSVFYRIGPLFSAVISPFQMLAEQLSKCSSAKMGWRAFTRVLQISVFCRQANVSRDECWLLTSKFS